MIFCPRCHGLLNTDNKGARCFCQNRPTSRAVTPSPVKEEPTDLFSESWLARNAKNLGPSCIVTVRRILNQLPPHFIQQGKHVLAEMPQPIFFNHEESEEIIRQRFRIKSHNIKDLIADLPKRHRQAVVNLAWLLDDHMSEKVKLEDCRIQWFNKRIEWEQDWLNALRTLDRLRESDFHPSDVPFVPDALLFRTCADYRVIRRNQEQLDRARSIVEEASAALAPAKESYLNPHFSRSAKQALAEACLPSRSIDKTKAAARVTALFNVIDPTRPVKPGDIRQTYYPRRAHSKRPSPLLS